MISAVVNIPIPKFLKLNLYFSVFLWFDIINYRLNTYPQYFSTPKLGYNIYKMWLFIAFLAPLLILGFKIRRLLQGVTYKGKTIWITGASSGIGEYLSYEFARVGAHVLLSGRNLEELERVHNRIPGSSSIVRLDLSASDVLFSGASEICKNHQVDVLINNAGVSQRAFFEDNLEDINQERKLMEVNYFSAVALTKAFVKSLHGRKGHVVVISSTAGLHGASTRTGYSASKAAITGYYESLRSELKDIGVCVTNIAPGFVNTNISINSLNSKGEKFGMRDPFNKAGFEPDYFAREVVKKIFYQDEDVIFAQFQSVALYKAMSFSPWLCSFVLLKVYTEKMKIFFAENKKGID